MAPVDLPPPDQLRRRIRAARALAGFDDVADLASRVHSSARLSERTLRKLETGESDPTVPQLREIAATCGVAWEWFTHPDLAHAPARDDPEIEPRLAALEARMAGWDRRLSEMLHEMGHGAVGAPETLRSTPPARRR
jgi:transcriptional regulator with XRE-family HTH domain